MRYAAMRKAQEAKQRRDAERLVRERKVEQALAEFFEHTATVEQIEADTAAKLAKVTAVGEMKTQEASELVAVALRAMLELGETRTAVAELTGWSLAAIRDAVATNDYASDGHNQSAGRHGLVQPQDDDVGEDNDPDGGEAPYWREGGDWST
ncbi:hypothetical protein GCM10010123_01950 [Pilimelia anulata]|uniref:Uncharacterized protein n=1 Tax=Pilimelia anulata TaxID=53371 RepID=A0A8J3B196_9ACTN|nr:hypothetical protein GCM10010123_01950 [Pilimelia anulata]